MQEKIYRFIFDKQTGLYKGLTYDQPWAENTTVLQPHFEAGFKTVFDFAFGAWKLVPQEIFYKQMSFIDDVNNVIELKNRYIDQRLSDFCKVLDLQTELFKNFNDRLELMAIRGSKVDQIFLDNRLHFAEIKKETDLICARSKNIEYIEDMIHDLMYLQEKHYLYSRKSYWTSRLVDSVVKFFKKFNVIKRSWDYYG